MGYGKEYKCSKCGHEYGYGVGVGFLFPMVYQELLSSVKEGKYGEEWKAAVLENENVAIDAETYLYCCESCGGWKTEKGLTLYVPKDPETLKQKQQEDDYTVLKEYIHTCPKCGKPVHRATREEEASLPCPECGGAPRSDYTNIIHWD